MRALIMVIIVIYFAKVNIGTLLSMMKIS